jgi:hypothetical protein
VVPERFMPTTNGTGGRRSSRFENGSRMGAERV